jgi:hypothetical protein
MVGRVSRKRIYKKRTIRFGKSSKSNVKATTRRSRRGRNYKKIGGTRTAAAAVGLVATAAPRKSKSTAGKAKGKKTSGTSSGSSSGGPSGSSRGTSAAWGMYSRAGPWKNAVVEPWEQHAYNRKTMMGWTDKDGNLLLEKFKKKNDMKDVWDEKYIECQYDECPELDFYKAQSEQLAKEVAQAEAELNDKWSQIVPKPNVTWKYVVQIDEQYKSGV